MAGRPHSNFINYRVDNALTRDARELCRLHPLSPDPGVQDAEGIAASIKLGNAAKIDF